MKKRRVQIENSKSGLPILRLMGRFISSPTDPQREAEKWYIRNQDLFHADTIIVLGAGSGYHIMELIRRRPEKKVLVIEPFKEVVRAVKEIHRHIFMLGAEFINISSIDEIYNNNSICEALRNHYSVVDYNLNVYRNEFLNFELIEFLNARSLEGLRFVAGLRGYLDEYDEQEYDEILETKVDLLSINSVEELSFDPFNSDELKWKKRILSKLIGGNG
ncbi:MAG: hypothetical protein CL677_05135 [Bdellovibrionaceae bacterium]|nr:hypothetical protein [Pseudobdellovibrionaceae bacterium]|tara:strand:+ start:88990 stop:89643 length:654 start_codon:yes stop_codon:yes gene_type:complete